MPLPTVAFNKGDRVQVSYEFAAHNRLQERRKGVVVEAPVGRRIIVEWDNGDRFSIDPRDVVKISESR